MAAAISAGFGAPIAGIVFAHEAVLATLLFAQLHLSSSVTASAVSQSFFNTSVTFNISTSAPDLVSVIPLLIIVPPIIAIAAIVTWRRFTLSGNCQRYGLVSRATCHSGDNLRRSRYLVRRFWGWASGPLMPCSTGIPTTRTDSALDRQNRDDCAMHWLGYSAAFFLLLYSSASLFVGSLVRSPFFSASPI